MKVLHIINNLAPAGAETLVASIVPVLRTRGIEVEVATLFTYDNKTLYDQLIKQDITVHAFNFSHRYNVRIYWVLKKFFKNHPFDIVHCHLFPTGYWVALCKPACSRLIFTEHNTTNNRMGSVVFKPIEHFIYGRFSSVVCVGHQVEAALGEWLPEYKNKLTTIYNGVELDKFEKVVPADVKKLCIPEGSRIGIMVARFNNQKDYTTLFKAVTEIPDFHVLCVGDGYNRASSEVLVKGMGLENRIHFLGCRNDVPALLKLCDIFILSSHFEGIPLSVIEAFASGIPVLGSNVSGLNEVIQNNISGLLFNEGDHHDLAKKIQQVLNNMKLQKHLSNGGLLRAREFSLSRHVDNLIAFYNS